jgi:hypothetical protein
MSRYLDFTTDRRPIDLQALLQGGFFSPETQGQIQGQGDVDRFGLDDFSRETGVQEGDLSRFFRDMQQQLQSDPMLLDQLNQVREQLGLPPLQNARQAGLQDPSSLMPEDLMALLVMWALQQENKRNGGGGGGGGGQSRGALPQTSFNNVRPANNNWGGGGSSGGGGGSTGGSSGASGSSSATGNGGSHPTAIPGGPVPDLPSNIGPAVPGQDGVPAGLHENAARGAKVVREVFGFDGTIGGLGERPGPSDHPHGNAIDVMTLSNMQQGQQIADFMVKHAQELGVKYVIFNQMIASPRDNWAWRPMEDRGSPTANHMDHVHISFNGPE